MGGWGGCKVSDTESLYFLVYFFYLLLCSYNSTRRQLLGQKVSIKKLLGPVEFAVSVAEVVEAETWFISVLKLPVT